MTAYGRASMTTELGSFLAEVQSLNRRYLEVNVFLPKQLAYLETEIRKRVSEKIYRGAVNIKISVQFAGSAPVSVQPNIPLATQIRSAWDKIANTFNLPKNESFKLEMLLNEPDILIYQEDFTNEHLYREAIFKVLDQALEAACQMKKTEGDHIHQDMTGRFDQMRQWIEQIEKKAPGSVDKYKKKLTERLTELSNSSIENEERILREICLYADKVDISEELTRFASHQKQFLSRLNGKEEGIGKTLEFLLQELQREANTINSKAADIDVSQLAVNIKGELEKIREQVQNVE